MEISIADQIALDDALVAPSSRLKMRTPFYKANQVPLADAPEIINAKFWASCLRSTKVSVLPSYDSLRLSQAQILLGYDNKRMLIMHSLLWEDFIIKIEKKILRRQCDDIRNSESYKEYYAMASGTIPPKTKGSKKKANTDTITKQKPPTAPTEKKSGKGKLKTTELESISEADLTEAEQLKIITKRSRQETHSSYASRFMLQMNGTVFTPGGFLMAPNYDSEDDISWNQVDDDQDDELKALEDNFSELRQTNQYAEALSSIPGIVDQYLANKMQEAVDVAVQTELTNSIRVYF
ncbi:hypothetical protein Tco_0767380 [Tanacetum coccineum]